MKKQRSIESFELRWEYYVESWVNGNKTHVKQELAELLFYNPVVMLSIIVELPQEISRDIVNSNAFQKHLISLMLNN